MTDHPPTSPADPLMSVPAAPLTLMTGDAEIPCGPRHAVMLVLDHLRSAYNVGNIFRLAEVGHLAGIITCGYTASPPHPKLRQTARRCDELVPWRHVPTAAAAVAELRAAGYHVVAVETVAGAPTLWDAPLAFPLALVFGNEALGIAPDALAACHACVRLPVYGRKNSLNVANCAAAVVYEALRQHYARGAQGRE